MHAIVVGCGRVGAAVARELVDGGHDVVVVDRRAESFRRLGADFHGRTMVGVGFDRDVLTTAGITPDSAVLAVTSGDNSNVLIARVARETFGVVRVVARIYDPARAAVYERLGIPTVASVAWTTARALRAVLPQRGDTDWIDPTSSHVLIERRIEARGAGTAIGAVEEAGGRVCLLARGGTARIPASSLLLQEDDVVHLMVPAVGVDRVDAVLAGTHEGAH